MSEWTESRIGNLGAVITGSTPPAKHPEWFGGSFPFITPTDITMGERRASVARTISDAGAAHLRTRQVPAGSVSFVCIASVGKVCLTDTDSFTNQQINTVVPGEDVDGTFLYYLLRHEAARIASYAGGAATPILNKRDFSAIVVRIPDLPTQRSIARVLGSLDDLIENNRRRVEVLEETARAIYREWFGRFRYPGHEDVSLVDSHLGPIPDGWEFRPLFDVADVGFGFPFKSKQFSDAGPFPVIRIRDVPNGTTQTYSDEISSERYRVTDGDILIGMDGEFHLRQWTGGEAWLNQRVARLRPTEDLSARHLMLAITGPIRVWNAAISGTTVAHLGKRHLEQIQILMPPRRVLNRATPLFNDLANEARALVQASRRLASLRDMLLPKLLTARIDVAPLDVDVVTEGATA